MGWQAWLGIALLVVMSLVFFKKPTNIRTPDGSFDTPIHNKPLFKWATYVIVFVITLMIIFSIN